MATYCEDKGCEIAALREQHSRVLWIVLAINALMFLVEGTAGVLARSTFLLTSGWPDILVGCLIASLFLSSALRVLRQSVRALRAAPEQALQGTKPVIVTLIKGSRST